MLKVATKPPKISTKLIMKPLMFTRKVIMKLSRSSRKQSKNGRKLKKTSKVAKISIHYIIHWSQSKVISAVDGLMWTMKCFIRLNEYLSCFESFLFCMIGKNYFFWILQIVIEVIQTHKHNSSWSKCWWFQNQVSEGHCEVLFGFQIC